MPLEQESRFALYSTGKSVPLQAWSGPDGTRKLRFPDFMTTAQEGGKVFGLTHRPHLPPGKSPGTHFYYRMIRPQGHSTIGRIMSYGIEPATLRFVAQHLNHCATAVPALWSRSFNLNIYYTKFVLQKVQKLYSGLERDLNSKLH